jgi:hypothetical protein
VSNGEEKNGVSYGEEKNEVSNGEENKGVREEKHGVEMIEKSSWN